jgi:hypothetical protein
VRAFHEFEEAIVWLWENEPGEKTLPRERTEEVPVKMRQRAAQIWHPARN